MPRRRDTRDRPLVMESLENPRKVVGKTGDGNSGKTGDLTAGVFLHGDVLMRTQEFTRTFDRWEAKN